MGSIKLTLSAFTIWRVGSKTRSMNANGLRLPREAGPRVLFLFAASIILLPVLTAIWFGITQGGGDSWDHILNNRVLPHTVTTLAVLALTGMLCLLFAVPTAWLVSRYRFPGRTLFSWALILPLAIPGYVMAYAWADLTNVAGPIQTMLRDATGWSARDYVFPDVFNIPGLSFVLATTLFPYVYITARAAFANQSLCTLEAARSLGANAWSCFMRVAVPAARPAIVAGLALALMEAAADYGAADFLGIKTLGVGVVNSWYSFSEPASAARLALILITIAFAFLFVERLFRGQQGSQQTSDRWRSPELETLTGRSAVLVTLLCGALLLVSFMLPVGRLLWLSIEVRDVMPDILSPLLSTLILASSGTLLALLCAIILTLSTRESGQQLARFAGAAGYAAPGAVLALGGVLLLAALGISPSGPFAFFILIWLYASRFTAAGTGPLESAMLRAPRSLNHAARSLSIPRTKRLFAIDLPLLRPGLFAGLLILFIETLKELPATFMLRPLEWETLAVKAHTYAGDERFAQAMMPSLLITLAGLAPVLLLSWQMSRSRRIND
ncbi:MAG: iron ABC transporter permease [Pseudomonadota bacterium]